MSTSDVSVTPAAQVVADEHGIDPAAIEGTGAGGTVTKPDVVAAVAATPADVTLTGPTTPLAGDVDVATIPTVDGKLDGEHTPPLTGESWVVLGVHEGVPDWAVGKPAAVISFPTSVETDEATGTSYDYLPDNALVTVRERSQGATFTLPLEAFSQISHSGGRGAVVNFP